MTVRELKLALTSVPDYVEVMVSFFDTNEGPIDVEVESTLYDPEDGTFTITEREEE